MNRSFFKPFFLYSIIIVLVCTLFVPIYSYYPELFTNVSNFIPFDPSFEFIWPIPEYTTNTSPYGKRISPTVRSLFFSQRNRYWCTRRNKTLCHLRWRNYFCRFLRWWWLYHYLKQGKYENYLLSCFS